MFRIDRTLVNLAGSQTANTDEMAAGAEGPYAGPYAPASAAVAAQEILEKAEQEAADIIEDAKDRAATIIHEAREEAQAELLRARQQGYAEGAEMGRGEFEEKIAEDDELLKNVLSQLHDERAQMLGGIEDELVELSLGIARKIIGIALEENDSVFESIIARALSQMELEGKLIIRVGTAEYARFFKSGSAVFDLGDGVTVTASVMKDASLNDGDFIIDTDNETISAGADTQLKLIKLAFDKADNI